MNDDRRILFEVSEIGNQTEITCSLHGEQDAFSVVFAIASIAQSNPALGLLLAKVMFVSKMDPEFQRIVDNHKIDLPDFNDLLKDHE